MTISFTFVVEEDAVDGGYVAQAHWPAGNRSIVTQGDTHDELLRNVRGALDATFDTDEQRPSVVHLHFVRDEVLSL